MLQAIHTLVVAAGLPGRVMLIWQSADAWGPCGSSNMVYTGPGHSVTCAGAAYALVNGERDPRLFLKCLEEIRLGTAEQRLLPGFPYIAVSNSEYQGIDDRVF